jgi:hypothetical protein
MTKFDSRKNVYFNNWHNLFSSLWENMWFQARNLLFCYSRFFFVGLSLHNCYPLCISLTLERYKTTFSYIQVFLSLSLFNFYSPRLKIWRLTLEWKQKELIFNDINWWFQYSRAQESSIYCEHHFQV